MLKRVITVVVGLPILVFFVYLGGLPLVALCTVTSLVGLKELYQAIAGGHKKIHLLGYGFTLAYFATIYLSSAYTDALTNGMMILTFFIVFAQGALVVFFKHLHIKDAMGTVYGVLYVPFLLAFTILVREFYMGHIYIWLVFTAAFGCDTFAYLTGSAIGKHKLVGTPSPSKTVEGLVGGVLGAGLVGALYGLFITQTTYHDNIFIMQAAIISAITAIFCIMGDMAASAIKRQTGIKDFGNVFPGHGGVMDRIDSIVMAAPVVYICIRVIM